MIEFQPWAKTPRFNRDVIITEKIDGTNAAIIIEPAGLSYDYIDEDYRRGALEHLGGIALVNHEDEAFVIGAQSRKRLIAPGDDNFGFAAWVAEHAEDLVRLLGPGRHFGEWWGSGIQRGYNQPRGWKNFSLFNVERYADLEISGVDGLGIVPELYRGPLNDEVLAAVDASLRGHGSFAEAGFMRPEGFIIFHTAAQQVFKVLLEGDDTHKGDQS